MSIEKIIDMFADFLTEKLRPHFARWIRIGIKKGVDSAALKKDVSSSIKTVLKEHPRDEVRKPIGTGLTELDPNQWDEHFERVQSELILREDDDDG